MKEKPSAPIQIDTVARMTRFDVTVVLYLTGETTAKYLSIADAASTKKDAVLKMK